MISIREKTLMGISLSMCLIFLVTLFLYSCSPQEAQVEKSVSSSSSEGAATAIEWNAGADCSACHSTQSAKIDNTESLLGKHYAQGASCVSCHSDVDSMKAVHKNQSSKGSATSSSKNAKLATSSCSSKSCHNLSPEELKALTAESSALVDDHKTLVNPHDIATSTPGHVAANMNCASCHTVHKQKNAIDYCVTCHHEGVFECGTCHA